MFRRLIPVLLCYLCMRRATAQTGYDTARILFPVNITEPDLLAQRQLDSFSKSFAGRQLLIYGYADYLGNTPANMQLAEGRAHNVATWLKRAGIREQDLLVVAGIGEVKRPGKNGKDGYPEDRCVLIFARRATAASAATALQHTALHKNTKEVTNSSAANNTENGLQSNMITAELGDIAHLKTGQSFPIRNLNFVYGERTLTPDSKPALDELYQAMKANPGLEIRLEGHICCADKAAMEQHKDADVHHLSAHRAQAVYNYLTGKGIDAGRMSYIGYGSTRPLINPEQTAADAAVNRRVEVRIIKNGQAKSSD